MTNSENESRSEGEFFGAKYGIEGKRYGLRKVRARGSAEDWIVEQAVRGHHYDVALLLASRGIRLGSFKLLETVEDGVTYVGWEAWGWPDTGLSGLPEGAVKRDDLLLAYDRLDREHREVLEKVGKVHAYIADPGNWSAYDNRRRLLLDWLDAA